MRVASRGATGCDEARRAVAALHADYAACLDDDRLEAWPGYFREQGVYRILSRENVARGLPAPIVYYYSRGMMLDRVTAIREALTFEFVYTRHVLSPPQVTPRSDAAYDARANFVVYQSTEEGVTRLFCVGEYRDVIELSGDAAAFRSRDAILDTFGVQNLIAVPL
jgi:3-phenylpropionate/cinnamic acid dioxygenase small subunit